MMMEKPLVSVVIPVYNVKEYLEECLNSVMNQTYQNLEIIIVDDGSTDGSSDICDAFAKRDSRIKVIHQDNCGVAIARKTAIRMAEGKYLCFVDSDDWIESTMVEFFVSNIGECDMITTGCHQEKKNGETFAHIDSLTSGVYETKEAMEYLFSNMLIYKNKEPYGILPFLVVKMFKADIIRKTVDETSKVLAYAEDLDLTFRTVLRCQSVCITHECRYYYRYRENSGLHSINKNFMHELNDLYLSLETIFQEHSMSRALIHQLQLFIMFRIMKITTFMGFEQGAQSIRYAFPFQDIKNGSKIILYGAGVIGNNYYRQIVVRDELEVVLWVDKNWEKYNERIESIVSPKQMKDAEYDYIIVAVKDETLVAEIRQELMALQIPLEKILWREPLSIVI